MLVPLLLMTLAGSPDAGQPSTDSVIDAVVKAYGGGAALKKSSAGRLDARVASRARGVTGNEVREWSLPGRLRVEIDYGEVSEVRILDGEKGWRGSRGEVAPVAGPPRDAMAFQVLRINPAWALNEYRARVEMLPPREVDKVRYLVLHLSWSPDLELNYLVDPRTSRVTRVQGAIRAGGGMHIDFGSAYDDFRTVEGVLFPFLEHNFASGTLTGSTTVTSVTFGPVEAGRFKP